MGKQNIHNISAYWLKTAENDYDTMQALFKAKRYSDSLFFGHLVLEKMLKSLVVLATKQQAPFIHDLIRLAELADIPLSDEETAFLNKVNDFNLRARYPDYKLRFYKQCTRKYTQSHRKKIEVLYKKLCQEQKQKK